MAQYDNNFGANAQPKSLSSVGAESVAMEHTQEQPPKGTGSNATDGSGTAKPDVPQPLVNVPQAAAPRATSPADPAAQSTTPTPNTNSTSTATTTGPTPAARHPAHPPPPSVPHPALPEAEQEEMRLLSRALDAGCSLLQGRGPVNKIHQHVDAFHMCVRAQVRVCWGWVGRRVCVCVPAPNE